MKQGIINDVAECWTTNPVLVVSPTLKRSLIPSEAPLEKAKFPFASGYHKIVSRLGFGMYVYFF